VLQQRRRKSVVPNSPPDVVDLQDKALFGLSLPLEVSVVDQDCRRESAFVKSHVESRKLPEGCMVDLGGDVSVASPELCFVQMANRLSLVKLIELGLELCGTYTLAVSGEAGGSFELSDRGFNNHPPLTSVKKLKSVTDRMEGVWGLQKAKTAIQYLADRSNSPMETILFMLVSLPYKHGGYSLPKPELNYLIPTVETAREPYAKTYRYCDLYWPQAGIAVEYDSDMYHTGATRIARDSIRRNALIDADVIVLTMTSQQLYNWQELENTVRQVANKLGRRIRTATNRDFSQKHYELRKQLL